jgi:hypothetical protein
MFMSISVPKKQKTPQGNADGPGNLTHRIRPGFYSRMLRKPANFRNHFQRGQATLEILIVLLILIPIIFGGIELSRGVAVRAALDSGVGVMVQAISIDPSPSQWSWGAGVVQQTVDQNVFGSAGLDEYVSLAAYDSSGSLITDPQSSMQDLPYGAGFCLIGSIGYSALIPLLPTLPPITIRVQHCGVIQKVD